jgi:glycosyltransferase involved in cell wall biosynthesis
MFAAECPQLSVVMPVHNALPHLDEAVQSILGQTFADFEFVILDDASTDGSTERLREWARRDSRIRLIELKQNLGPALSSDRVARAANAPFVARMDADDISAPTRLAEQLKLLKRRPEVGLVGGLALTIDQSGRRIRGAERWRLLLPASTPPMHHGTIMYRRDVFERAGGYRKECEFWEDCDLIIRMTKIATSLVLPYAIYSYRQSPISTRLASEQERVERAVDLAYRSRDRLNQGLEYDDLLSGPATKDRLDPRVFISLGSITLWAGGRPRLFQRLLRRGDLRANVRSLSALIWTAWASTEPHSLRGFIRLLLLARRARAWLLLRSDGPVLWSAAVPRAKDDAVTVPAE